MIAAADVAFPALEPQHFRHPRTEHMSSIDRADHPPRFLMLYGSLRERSFSKLLTLEAKRLLERMGGEVRVFDPAGLPLPDDAPDRHPKVEELRALAAWCEGMVCARRSGTAR